MFLLLAFQKNCLMNKYKLLALLLFCPFLSFAQFILKGSVSAEGDKKLANARIYMEDLNRVFITDSAGFFTIQNLSPGVFTISFSHLGYNPEILKVNVSGNAEVNVVLKTARVEIKEVVVSETRQSLKDETTLNIDILTREQIENKGNVSVTDAIATIPGAAVISTGPGVGRPIIRGLSGNRVLTLLNGSRLENQQWDPEHALGISQFGFDHVEIIKGPASFLYGPEAMGGVLNFVEEKPAAENTVEGDLFVGQHSNTVGTLASAGLRGAREKFYYNFRGGFNNHSDYYNGGKYERVANSRFREGVGKAVIGYNSGKYSTQFTYQFNMGYYGIVEPFEAPNAEEEDHPMEFETPYHVNQHHTAVWKNTFLLGNNKLKTLMSLQHDDRKELEPNDTEEKPFIGLRLNTGYYDIKWEGSGNSMFSYVIGTQGSLLTNWNKGYTWIIPDYNQNDIGVYSTSKLSFQRVVIDAAIRYDKRTIRTEKRFAQKFFIPLDKTYENLSGSIGTRIHTGKENSIKLNATSGFRAPNAAELTSNGFRVETQRYEFGNIKFRKEQNLQLDLSDNFESENFALEASVFYNYINNYIFFSPTGVMINKYPAFAYKQDNATLKGAELALNIQPSSWKAFKLSTALSYVEGKTDSTQLPLMPPLRWRNEITFNFQQWKSISKPYVSVSGLAVFKQDKIASYEYQTPGYFVLNLYLGGEYIFKGYPCQITLGANNLLNKAYIDHLSRLRPYSVYSMGTDVFLNVKVPFLIKRK